MVSRTARFSEFVRAFLLFLVPAMTAQSQTFKLLYTFTGGADGLQPDGTLLLKNGILYGTTYGGGASGQGTVFELMLQPGLHGTRRAISTAQPIAAAMSMLDWSLSSTRAAT